MSSGPLPLVLRKDDHLVLAVYDESKKGTGATSQGPLTELDAPPHLRYTGDYRECEVCFNPARPSRFAHATTTHLRYSEVVMTVDGGDGGSVFTLRTIFEVEMPHVIANLAFSPLGTYLIAYACMDSKRTPDGNMSIFETTTGSLVRRVVQVRWPAMAWASEEEYVVRPVQGWMHVLDGAAAASTPALGEGGSGSGEAAESPVASDTATTGVGTAPLKKMDLMLAQDKDIEFSLSPKKGFPVLALFKPFYKNRPGTFSLYRLPKLDDGPLYQVQFGRAEGATILWSHSGNYVALLVKSERDPSGKSYYGTITLHIVDVMNRRITDVKFKGDEGGTVHDCQWSPICDELLVVHGKMPHNKTTLLTCTGVPLITYGEAPRNMCLWAPNGTGFVLGGSGNLAGDYQFYSHTPGATTAAAVTKQASTALPVSECVGEFNDKCSFHTWAPDSHNFLCATVFTRLRMSNRTAFFKNNGEHTGTTKFDVLYGAHWVAMKGQAGYPVRPPSPRPVAEAKAKSAAYRPPGGTSRAAELLRKPDPASTQKATPSGPVGATLVVKKKKRR